MREKSRIGSYIFGLLFFGVGAFLFYVFVGSQLVDWVRMQSWPQAQAQLIHAELESYSATSDGGRVTMYRPKVSYQYLVDGLLIEGDRAGLSTAGSNERQRHSKLVRKIRTEQSQNGFILVRYSPASVQESIYDTSINWRLAVILGLFTSVFMLIGAGTLAYTFFKSRQRVDPAQVDPDKPWTQRPEWASPRVYSQAGFSARLFKFLAVLSVFFFGVFSLALFGEGGFQTGFAIALLIPPAWVIRKAYKVDREHKLVGKTPLAMNPYPGVIGGTVGGLIELTGASAVDDEFTLELVCRKHWVTGSGKNRKHNSAVVWQSSKQVAPSVTSQGCEIPFEFDVPAECPSSSPSSNGSYHRWQLYLKGGLGSISVDRHFELPVFATEASRTVEEELIEQPLAAEQVSDIAARVSLKEQGHGLSFRTRGDGANLGIIMIGAALSAFGIFFMFRGVVGFGAVFTVIALAFALLGVYGWGRCCEIDAQLGSCVVKVAWRSIPLKTLRLSRSHIQAVEAYRSSSQSGTDGYRAFYALRLIKADGKRLSLGGGFKSEREATHLKLKLEEVLGIRN